MKATVVTAPEHRYFPPYSMRVFLAGGICKCPQWQQSVIELFKNHKVSLMSPYKHFFILNPRRVDWINEPGAAERQIEWEFDMIEKCDMFTMYFSGGESDQPICMYELGRNLERMKQKFPGTWTERIVITCDSSYKRLNDVLVQTSLATDDKIKVNVVNGEKESILAHFNTIAEKLDLVDWEGDDYYAF